MEPAAQSKPRGRRRKMHKLTGQSDETDTTQGKDEGTESKCESSQRSSIEEEYTESDIDPTGMEGSLSATWDVRQTPPLEKCSEPQTRTFPDPDSSPTSDNPDVAQKNMERRSKKPRRRKDDPEKLDHDRDVDTSETRHITKGTVARENRTSTIEESCTAPMELVYNPIHLPLSCEIYTPAYCVQATDRCDKNSETDDQTPGQKVKLKTTKENDGKSIDMITIQKSNQVKVKNQQNESQKNLTYEQEETEEKQAGIKPKEGKENKPQDSREKLAEKSDISGKRPRYKIRIGKKAKSPKVDVGASLPGVEISGPKLQGPDVQLGMDVGGGADVGADVRLPKADVSVKAPKFGFKFGKKAKAPKVEGPSAGVSASGGVEGDLGVDVKGEAPRGGFKLRLPKLRWPKGSLKLGGDADVSGKVKPPEASVDISGPGVSGAVQLPEVPSVDASVSLPGFDVGQSGEVKGDLGGEVSLGGGVAMPSAEVSVPSKKFHFGFGGKAKGGKKLKKPKVSGDAGLGVDVGADVQGPEVDVHGVGGKKAGGWKFGWSPKISLPKLQIGQRDLSADAELKLPEASVDISGPAIKLPSVSGDVEFPRVDVQLADVSAGGDIGGGLDVSGAVPSVSAVGDVKLPDLSVSGQLPSVDVGGDVGLTGADGSVGVDLSMPKMEVDASMPSVDISGPRLEMPDVKLGMDVGGVADVGADVSLPKGDVPLKFSEFGGEFPISVDKYSLSSVNVPRVSNSEFIMSSDTSGSAYPFGGRMRNDFPAAELAARFVSVLGPCFDGADLHLTGPDTFSLVPKPESEIIQSLSDIEQPVKSSRTFWSLRFPTLKRQKISKCTTDTDVDSGIGVAETAFTTRTGSVENLSGPLGSPAQDEEYNLRHTPSAEKVGLKMKTYGYSTLPRWFRMSKVKLTKGHQKPPEAVDSSEDSGQNKRASEKSAKSKLVGTGKGEKTRKGRKTKKALGGIKKTKPHHIDTTPPESADACEDGKPIRRISSAKSKDLLTRQTWHGVDEVTESHELTEPPTLPPTPSGIHIQPVLYDNLTIDVRRRDTSDSIKRRPWSTLESPPPGCIFVNDDYLFPDALTPTKIPSFRGSKDAVYNVPYMDDKALPPEEPDWPIGESRRTLLSQLSQKSDSIVRIAAEEESSIISLDDNAGRSRGTKIKSKRSSSTKKQAKGRRKNKDAKQQKSKDTKGHSPRSKSSSRFAALFRRSSRQSK